MKTKLQPGQVYGKLTTVEFVTNPNNPNQNIWECICECGNKCYFKGKVLLSGNNKTCGKCGPRIKNEDLIGRKFNKLSIIAKEGKDKWGKQLWKCQCECGRETILTASVLKSGNTTTCGYCVWNTKHIGEFNGQRFGRLTIIDQNYDIKNRKTVFLARCDCGVEKAIIGADIRRGKTTSCGMCDNYKVNIGDKFGMLTVIEDTDERKYDRKSVICVCDCGNRGTYTILGLHRGNTMSCGCRNYQNTDKSGQKFGRLLAIKKVVIDNRGYYECKCDCGNTSIVDTSHLNKIKSCGCLIKELASKRMKAATGDKNPNWRGGITEENLKIRSSSEYKEWRNNVLERDNNICQVCGDDKELEVHHLYSFHDNENLRLEKDNGISTCIFCHQLYHMEYGYGNNTPQQFNNFLESLGLQPITRPNLTNNTVS